MCISDIYYGDEWGDRTLETTGGQKDNVARTSGHIVARNDSEQQLHDFTAQVMNFRKENPAMWRGTSRFEKQTVGDANVLVVRKSDSATGNEIIMVFSDRDTTVPVHGIGGIDVDAWRPELVKIK